MSEPASAKYMVRDPQGNVYGPADIALLRAWINEGRIIAGMHIAPRETREWIEVSQHPALADLFRPQSNPPVSPTPTTQPRPAPDAFAQPKPPSTDFPPPFEVAPRDVQVQPATPRPAGGTVPYFGPASRSSPLALWSMIAGIVSVVFALGGCVPVCGCVVGPLGILAGIAALVMGYLALNQIRQDAELLGKNQAIAAMVMGGVAVFGFICAMVVQYLTFRS